MSSEMKVLATICARGGSKGVPGKNLARLNGRTLLEWAIECARRTPAVGSIVVSTDSDEIAAEAERCGVRVPFRRPEELASDRAPKVGAIRHATEWVEASQGFIPDIVVDLDVGVPLRSPDDVGSCILALVDDPALDAAVTVYEAERNPYFNMVQVEKGRRIRLVCPPVGNELVRRQDAPEVFSVSPSVFAFRRAALGRIVHLAHGEWGFVRIPRERAMDIDTPLDFRLVSCLAADLIIH